MKKFFKILMVFALLSGAALSCTKDYSKEIADLQSQNKDLQALVATLQNALNSTNATVSQLSATSEKHTGEIAQIIADHASDIAELAAKDGVLAAQILELIDADADLEQAIEDLDEKVAGELAQLLVTHNTDIENVKTLFDGKLDALESTLTNALNEKAGELKGLIDGLDGRVTVAEGEIDDIQTTLGEIDKTLKAYKELIDKNKELIDKNITDIAAAQDAIAKLQAQVKTLSARLTNIVAAPAKDIELMKVELGTIQKSILNMEFIVAPESAAKVIADQFAEGKVDVTYALYNGIDRTKGEQQKKLVVDGIKPHKVVANGAVITVTADVTEALKEIGTLQEGHKRYVTIAVAGEDEAGKFERISDPVSPIYKETLNIEFQWYKGDAKVATVADYTTFQTELKVAKDAYEDTVYVRANGTDLYIGAEDADWKTQLPFADNNILNGYELKYETRSHKALTIAETADYLGIEASKIAPHFTETTTAPKKTYTLDEYEQVEWSAYPSDTKAHNLFSASASKTDLTLTAAIKALPGSTDPEKAEFVGAYAEVVTEHIALGTVKTLGVVKYTKRIGKHVATYKAAEPLVAQFAFNHPNTIQADTTYKYIAWLSETDVSRHEDKGHVHPKVSEGVFNKTSQNGTATLATTQSQAKFCDVKIEDVKFAAADKEYMIVWELEPYVNGSGVQAEDYYDYIDLTVEKYHPAVKVAASCEAYVGRTQATAIKTDKKAEDIFANDNTWYLNDTPLTGEPAALLAWYKNGFGTPSALKIVETGKTTPATGITANTIKLSVDPTDGYLYVTIPADTQVKFKTNQSYTITFTNTIETAKFDYTITLVNKKIEVAIKAIEGFDLKDSVEVGAKSLQVGGAWTYVINDINLSQYYKIVNFDKKNVNDAVTANFKTPASVKYITGSSVPCSAVASTTDGSLDPTFKIQWNTYNKPSFKLKAWSAVAGVSQVDTIELTYWTKTPVKVINTVAKDTLAVGHAGTFDLFQDFDVRGIVDDFTKNLIDHQRGNTKVLTVTRTPDCPGYGFNEKLNADGYVAPTVASIDEWTCTVNGIPYGKQETKDLFSTTPAWACDAVGSKFELPFKEHSAIGTIVLTIPCTWEYSVGTLEFDMVYTLYNL